MARIQTIWPGFVPEDYFTKENIDFLSRKITQMIHKDITTDVVIDTGSIVRVMQRILEQRLEDIPKMNQRVIMSIVSEYLDYQIDVNKKLNWADAYVFSQRLYDPSARRGAVSSWGIKLNPKNMPTTSRFYFT
jgi:hypothetical protein